MRIIIILAIVFIALLATVAVIEASGPGSAQAQRAINMIGHGGRGSIAKWRTVRMIAAAERRARAASCPCAAVSYRQAKARIKAGRWAAAYTLLRSGQSQSAYCYRQGRQ